MLTAGPTTYPGGKNGAGVYQTIINQMPPHEIYIEPFAGSGAIIRRKRPARINIAIDLAAEAVAALQGFPAVEAITGCGLDFLERHHFTGRELVYADPPYLKATRKYPDRDIYEFEMNSHGHDRLLRALREAPCLVMISAYRSDLYDAALAGWRTKTFQAQTRGGTPATETLYMNYPEPQALHDYSFLGENFRQRERIKRKANRWRLRLQRLPETERRAILSALRLLEEARERMESTPNQDRRK